MRRTGLGALIGAVLVLLAGVLVQSRNQATAQPNGGPEFGGELITFTSQAPENRQQLTVIDPRNAGDGHLSHRFDDRRGVAEERSQYPIRFDDVGV